MPSAGGLTMVNIGQSAALPDTSALPQLCWRQSALTPTLRMLVRLAKVTRGWTPSLKDDATGEADLYRIDRVIMLERRKK